MKQRIDRFQPSGSRTIKAMARRLQEGMPSFPGVFWVIWIAAIFWIAAVPSLAQTNRSEAVSTAQPPQVLTPPSPPTYAQTPTNPIPATNVPSPKPPSQPPLPTVEIPPSLRPFLIKGSVGFVVGLAIGVAVRAIAKLVLFLLGLVCLAVLVMAYLGWVQIQWSAMLQDLQAVAEAFRQEFSSFREFLNGTLPAVVLTGLGVALGMRFGRRR